MKQSLKELENGIIGMLFSLCRQEETTVHMAKMLKVNVRLCEIHLAHFDMRDFGAERLKENLFDNLTLTRLDLRR